MAVQRKHVRLACSWCDREDYDGAHTLAEARKAGWRGIGREQTYAQSCKTYASPEDAPPGYSVMDWFTHVGTCPDCCELCGGAKKNGVCACGEQA